MSATIHRLDATASPEYSRLTQRQKTVLRLTAEGMCMKDIGRTMGVATGTVKAHRCVIRQVLGADQYRRYVYRGAA